MAAMPERPAGQTTASRRAERPTPDRSWLAAHAERVAYLASAVTFVLCGFVAVATAVGVSVAVSGVAGAIVFFTGGLLLVAAVPTVARLAGQRALAALDSPFETPE